MSIMEEWLNLQRQSVIDKEEINLKLDLKLGGTVVGHTLKQADHNSRIITITLSKDGGRESVDLFDSQLYLFVRKADSNIVMLTGFNVDLETSSFKVAFTEQALACVGDIECEVVKIGNDGSKLSFPIFKIPVAESIHDDEHVVSSTELSGLAEQLAKVENWNGQVDSAIASCENKYNAKYDAQASDFNNIFNNSQTQRQDAFLQSQRERESEFKTWQNLAMSQQVAIDLQNQINNMPFFKIID